MKITAFDGDVENISKLEDRPNIESGYTADALKALFDKAGVDIKEYINSTLIEELASATTGKSGADKIGSGTIANVSGSTVQDKLKSLSNQINELTDSSVPDGSITIEKLDSSIANFINYVTYDARTYTRPGTYSFAVPRDGTYKVTVVGGGAGGGVLPTDVSYRLGGGSGATSVIWCSMCKGAYCTFIVGKGGAGLTVDGTTFVANAQDGGGSSFSVDDMEWASAEGGKFGLGQRAQASGGTFNYNGGYPKVGDIYDGEFEFNMGGDSACGNGGAFAGDTAGVGGGGYAGEHIGNGAYNQGYNGGDGIVVIEYLQ